MAENKKAVLMYVDLIHVFESLKDSEAGKLIKHFFRYVNDLNPEPPDKLTKICFEPIKQQLKRDLVKWEQTKEKLSDAGKKSAEIKKERKKKSTLVKQVKPPSTSATVTAVDTVTAVVTEPDNVIPLKRKQPRADALIFPVGVSDEFMKTWDELVKQPKWKNKSPSALQYSLKILAKYSDEQGVDMMGKAIAGNWQGLVEPTKQFNNGGYQKTGTGGSITEKWFKSGSAGGTGNDF